MAKLKTRIPFFTDQCVPDSVGNSLINQGHNLIRLRDVMDADTPDPVISIACSRSGNVLITHDKDFRSLSKRLQISQRQYHNKLHRVLLRCSEPESSQRILDALSRIENEWLLVGEDRPMVIEIASQSIKTIR